MSLGKYSFLKCTLCKGVLQTHNVDRLQRVAAQPHHLHFTRTTVMLTLSNQAEIWCEASYDQNLIPNEISAHLDD